MLPTEKALEWIKDVQVMHRTRLNLKGYLNSCGNICIFGEIIWGILEEGSRLKLAKRL